MASVRLRNTATGVVVQVREDKVLGAGWEPVKETKPPAKSAPKSTK